MEWEKAVFSPMPRKNALLQLQPPWPLKKTRINVRRNHGFEVLKDPLRVFLNYAGIEPVVACGAYDDSLSFQDNLPSADIEILWLDLDKYTMNSADLLFWLKTRLADLRKQTTAPLLFVSWPGTGPSAGSFDGLPGLCFCDFKSAMKGYNGKILDPRLEAVTGTRLAAPTQLLLARALGLVWIPAASALPVKAVVFDLDNTLYGGVLGESGIEGVESDSAYQSLQRHAAKLRKRGLFLGLSSKNDSRDVKAFFETRKDLAIKLEDFSAQEISWQPKSTGIAKIASALRVGIDSILFVDDNPAELLEVSNVYPDIRTLLARSPAETLFALELFPGLFRWKTTAEDIGRIRDLEAVSKRTGTTAGTDYLATLGTEVEFYLNPSSQLTRISELLNKTNQFNLTLLRLNEAEVSKHMKSGTFFVTAGLRDRLSDSGIISLVMAHIDGVDVIVDNVCISCRALGRGLEDYLIRQSLAGIKKHSGLENPQEILHFVEGPRNAPAKAWYDKTKSREPESASNSFLPVKSTWHIP